MQVEARAEAEARGRDNEFDAREARVSAEEEVRFGALEETWFEAQLENMHTFEAIVEAEDARHGTVLKLKKMMLGTFLFPRSATRQIFMILTGVWFLYFSQYHFK